MSFSFRTDAPFDRIFGDGVASMVEDSELSILESDAGDAGPRLFPGEGRAEQLDLYANILENFLEGYRVAARDLHAVTWALTLEISRSERSRPANDVLWPKRSDDAKL